MFILLRNRGYRTNTASGQDGKTTLTSKEYLYERRTNNVQYTSILQMGIIQNTICIIVFKNTNTDLRYQCVRVCHVLRSSVPQVIDAG